MSLDPCDIALQRQSERSTTYLVLLRDKDTGAQFEAAFHSATERAIYILSVDHWATVEREWMTR